MSGDTFDVVVIGGGPAGTATALALRRHAPWLSVAVLERTDYERFRVGETLAPGVEILLHNLGLHNVFPWEGAVEAFGTYAAWGSPDVHENAFIYQTKGAGWHVDRRAFDAMLVREAISAGVEIFRSVSVDSLHRAEDGYWKITAGAAAGRGVSLRAAFIVDAGGRQACVAKWCGVEKIVVDRMVSVYGLFRCDAAAEYKSYTLVEACPDGWWYSSFLPDGWVIAAYMSDADLLPREAMKHADAWQALLQHAPHTRNRLKSTALRQGPRVVSASTRRLDRVSGENWLAVGDAAWTIDPLSGQGIFNALKSGTYAAYAISDYLNGNATALPRYEAFCDQAFYSSLETRTVYYALERRWSHMPFWARRRSLITLDPDQIVCYNPEEERGELETSGTHLSRAHLAELRALCASPRPAHVIAATFKDLTAGIIPDRRIILALQEIAAPIEQRQLSAATPDEAMVRPA